MRLVPDWRKAWCWHSIRANALGAFLSAAAGGLALATSAGQLAGAVPVYAVCGLFCAIFVLALVGRLIAQGEPEPKPVTVPPPK